MSYVIKDIEKKYWLGIDRVINNTTCDITTVVEPIYSYKAATKFDSIDECKAIMDQIKAEGNYDIPAYATENVEEMIEAEKKAEEEKTEAIRKIAQEDRCRCQRDQQDKSVLQGGEARHRTG